MTNPVSAVAEVAGPLLRSTNYAVDSLAFVVAAGGKRIAEPDSKAGPLAQSRRNGPFLRRDPVLYEHLAMVHTETDKDHEL